MRLMTLSFALLLSTPATAASLRPATTLSAPVVRLSDLFEDAGSHATKILGPAPGPGGRITVEAPQLAAIARQFGVDWRPVTPADRAVLDRPGKPIAKEEVMDALRAQLTAAGAPADCDIEMSSFTLPLVPSESSPRPAVSQTTFDPASGRFSALLTVADDGMEAFQIRLAGRAHEAIDVVVPARRLLPGEVLRAADLRPARVRAATVRTEVARSPAQAIGLTPRHAVSMGQPLPLDDLVRPAAVHKGAAIMLVLDGPGLALTGQGQALEPGAIGERVRVLNPVSRAVVEALVIGPDRVRVEPGSAPLMRATQSAHTGAR